MSNKVSIFIENSKGEHFELTNSKMVLEMACKNPSMNWNVVFPEPIGPYDILICDFANSKAPAFGLGYRLVEHCCDKETSEKIIKACLEKLKKQYERMMEIRVAKKYGLSPDLLTKLQMEYFDSENHEIRIKDYL